MKTTKILYWVATILIVGLMVFSAISSFIPNPDGAKMAEHMQYPIVPVQIFGGGQNIRGYSNTGSWFCTLKRVGLCRLFLRSAWGDCFVYYYRRPHSQYNTCVPVIAILFVSYFLYHKLKHAKQA